MRTPHTHGTPARDPAPAVRVYESRRTRLFIGIAASLFLLLLAVPDVSAQTTGSATVRGVIKDANGDVVPGATVTLTSQKTSAARSTVSNEDGLYVFAQVDPDVYTLQVEASSFRTYVQTELRVSPADTRGQDVTLEVGGASETITVTTQEEVITETGEKAHTITASQIQNLSLIGRSSLELLRILPGVVAPDGTDLQTTGFNSGANANANYSVNGLRGVNNNVSIDGSRVIDIGSNNGTIVTANNDFVEEVKVQVSNYAAEHGNSAVQISAVTKGGGKDFHGSLYTYYRPWQVAANDRSRTIAGGDLLERPRNRYIYPGGTISGPVLIPGTDFNKNRDKMFFFLGLEAQRQRTASDTRYAVVPTLRQRMGDFGEFFQAGNPDFRYLQQPTPRIPGGFEGAGGIAPGGNLAPYIDPIGQSLINLYPEPNGIYLDGLFNYATAAPSETNRWDWKMRFDYKFSENTSMFVRWARETETTEYPYGIWWQASRYELPSPVQGDNLGRSLSVSLTSVISPTAVNEVVFSASKLKLDNDYRDPSRVTREALGLEGFGYPFGPQSPYAPIYIASWGQGLGELWSPGALPLFAYNDSFAVTDNFSKVVGSHSMKFGGLVEQANKEQNFQNNAEGQIVLSNWGAGSTGNDFADLLVNRPTQLAQSTGAPIGEFRLWNVEGYAQDSWKLRSNFTLEYGVRVSYFPNNYERNGLGAVFDPDAYVRGAGQYIDGDPQRPNGILLAARGEIPKGVVDNPPVKLAPRFGFAWDIWGNAETVIRGGSGVFYNRVQGNYQYDVLRLPPNAFDVAVNSFTISGLGYENFGEIDPFSLVSGFSPVSQDPEGNDIPRIVTTSFSVAQRLPLESVLEVSYVGTQGRHLPQRVSINAIGAGGLSGTVNGVNLNDPIIRAALDTNVVNQFRPYSDFGDVTYTQFTGTSTYHSLQATLSRRQSPNFQYFLTYTFSKALGTQAVNETGSNIDPLDTRGRSYGILPYDRTQIFNATYIWQVPDLARGKLDNGVARALLDGWQVSGITSITSGVPLTINITGDYQSEATRRAYFGSPSSTLGLYYTRDPRTGNTDVGDFLLNANALALPGLGDTGAYQSPFYLRSPTRYNTDITLFKYFNLTERQNIEFRAGFFNIFNQAFSNPNLGDINLNLQTECIRRLTGVPNGAGGTADICDPTGGYRIVNADQFGRIVNKHGHRIIEFALKYNF
jgi:hypothetical protein